MPPADLPDYKDLSYFLGGGLPSPSNTTEAGLYLIDSIFIEQR